MVSPRVWYRSDVAAIANGVSVVLHKVLLRDFTGDGAVVVGEGTALVFSSKFKQMSELQYAQALEVK